MTNWLKEATVATLSVGPATDGSGARLGSLNIIRGEMQLSKEGAAYATISGVATANPDAGGNYFVGFDATDLNTRGRLRLDINNSGALPIWEDFMVVPTQAYDALFAGDRFQTDVREFGDSGLDFTSTMKSAIGSQLLVGTIKHVGDTVISNGGSIAFLSDGILGTLGFARALGSIAAGIIGTISHAQSVGTSLHAQTVGTTNHVTNVGDKTGFSLVADQESVRIGTVTHVADGLISTVSVVGSLNWVKDGLIGTVTFVRDGLIGTVSRILSVGSLDAGIVGTVSHATVVGSLSGIGATAQNDIADAILKRDLDQAEATAAVHSLLTAVLKGVARVRDNNGTLEIYRTDGTTVHAQQTITTDPANDPIDELTGAV